MLADGGLCQSRFLNQLLGGTGFATGHFVQHFETDGIANRLEYFYQAILVAFYTHGVTLPMNFTIQIQIYLTYMIVDFARDIQRDC